MVLPAEALTTGHTITAAVVNDHTGTRPRRITASRWIDGWDAEDLAQWDKGGKQVAQRNLFSIFSEHIGFCVWSLWSVFVLFLGKDYGLTAGRQISADVDTRGGRCGPAAALHPGRGPASRALIGLTGSWSPRKSKRPRCVDVGLPFGSEAAFRRPAVVITDDDVLDSITETFQVVPFSSTVRDWPTDVSSEWGEAQVHLITTVSRWL